MRVIAYVRNYWKESMAGFAPLERPKGDPYTVLRMRSIEEAWEAYYSGLRDFWRERAGKDRHPASVLRAKEEQRKMEEEWADDWKEVKVRNV
jgi:hypothetical protein